MAAKLKVLGQSVEFQAEMYTVALYELRVSKERPDGFQCPSRRDDEVAVFSRCITSSRQSPALGRVPQHDPHDTAGRKKN